jgi:hypothetical protein
MAPAGRGGPGAVFAGGGREGVCAPARTPARGRRGASRSAMAGRADQGYAARAMVDEHLTPVLMACSESELAVLIEFLGRPPTGLMWSDRRLRDPRATREERVAAVVERILRLGAHSVLGRTSPGGPSYLQVVCDALEENGVTEAPAAGIGELEQRVVRYVLDAGFDALPEDTQQTLLAKFYAGETYADGIADLSFVHDYVTHVVPERKALLPARAARVAGGKLADKAIDNVKKRLLRLGLRVVLRGAAGPIYQAIRVWGWLGPAFRYTVPAIAYVAYLRWRQAAPAQAA